MASDITTAAAVTTANMKPDSGEQLDALWGQNIADNSGYNYWRPELAFSFWFHHDGGEDWDTLPIATHYFTKRPEWGTLYGSYSFHGTGLVSMVLLNPSGGTIKQLNATSVAGTTTSGSFVYVITALSDSTDYTFRTRAAASSGVGNPRSVDLSLTAWLGP